MGDNQVTDDDREERIELVKKAADGDREAFTELYRSTYTEVYHTVKVFIHNEDTVQDIVQETYFKCLRKIRQLKEPEKFPVWIKKIAVNTAKAHLRKVDWVLFSEADGEGGKSIAELQDERLEHLPEFVVDQTETKELIDRILEDLDDRQRLVVGMFYYEQMSVNEIAETLSCNANTVKSRLNYARKKIGKEISNLEKKGVLLHTAAPIPVLMYLFQKLRGIQEKVPKAKFLIKAGIGKAVLTGVAAAVVCVGIGTGVMKNQDMHQQVQEIQELLLETDNQKTGETQVPRAEGIEEENGNDTPVVTPTLETTPLPAVTPESVKKSRAASIPATESEENDGEPERKSAAQENTDDTANTGSQQPTSVPETDQHTHQWVQQTETVHHEASGHYETEILQEAYEEPVYEYHVFCDTCGADVNTSALEHKAIHDNGFTSKKIQTGSIHHDAVTQEVWVEEPAYDEVVTRGYVCSVCGAGE